MSEEKDPKVMLAPFMCEDMEHYEGCCLRKRGPHRHAIVIPPNVDLEGRDPYTRGEKWMKARSSGKTQDAALFDDGSVVWKHSDIEWRSE
jgi:hypothetical protein